MVSSTSLKTAHDWLSGDFHPFQVTLVKVRNEDSWHHPPRPWLLYFLLCLPLPCLSSSPLMLSTSACLHWHHFPSTYVCAQILCSHPSCLWSILLFIFSRKYSFHSLAIHPPHNLYKLISPCLYAKNVFPEVQITKSSGLFSKLSLVLNRIGHLNHPSLASPLWCLCPGFWELLCLPYAGGGECRKDRSICASSETYSFFSLWMSDWWVTPKFLSSA